MIPQFKSLLEAAIFGAAFGFGWAFGQALWNVLVSTVGRLR